MRRQRDGAPARPCLALACADARYWTRRLAARALRHAALRLDPRPTPPAREKVFDPELHQRFWQVIHGDD